MKPGFNPAQWETAKTEMRRILTEKAAMLQMVTYGDLASEVKAVRFEAYDPDMWYMLGLALRGGRCGRSRVVIGSCGPQAW